jgi:hypothetical protein
MLALVFLASAVAKAGNFGGFVAAVRQLRLVPATTPRLVARLVVAAEFATVGLLLLPAPEAGFGLAVVLAVLFSVVIEISVRRGIRVPCPCFGASGDFLNRKQLVRNALLVVVAVVGLVSPAATGALELVEIMISVAVAGFLAAVVIRFDDVADLLMPRPAVRR